MKQFKAILAKIILNIFTISIVVVLISKPPVIHAIGAIPTDCENLTNTNPRNTPYCNPSCSRTNCITYCPAYNNGAHIKITSNFTDLVIKYKAPTHPIYITVPGTSIQNYKANCSSNVCVGEIKDTSHTVFKKGSTLTIIIRDRDGYAIGYRLPDSSNNCGENNICKEDGGHYENFNISDILTKPDHSHALISKQCYGDAPIGDSDFDFNDYAITIFGKPVPVVGKDPFCIALKPQKNSNSQNEHSYTFKCTVKGNVKSCKFEIGSKTIISDLNEPDGCAIDYTFAHPGDYKATCYAVNNKKEVTNGMCTQLIHIPTNTAGGLLIPISIGLFAGIVTLIWGHQRVLNKHYHFVIRSKKYPKTSLS